MRRFSEEDVRSLLSQDHLHFTAFALGKSATDVTAEDLISHWVVFHPIPLLQFTVAGEEDILFIG